MAGPTGFPEPSQLNATCLSTSVKPPVIFQVPRQKLLVLGSRDDEFMISVPSLCHWTYAEPISAPSGMPFVLPSATKSTFQNPTIGVPGLKSTRVERNPLGCALDGFRCQMAPFSSGVTQL